MENRLFDQDCLHRNLMCYIVSCWLLLIENWFCFMNSSNLLGRACLFLKLLNFVFNFNLTLELQEGKRAKENFQICCFLVSQNIIDLNTFTLVQLWKWMSLHVVNLFFCHTYWYYGFVKIMIICIHQVNWVKCPKYVHNTVNFNQKKNDCQFLLF